MDTGVYNQILGLNQDLLNIRKSLDIFLQDSASADNIGYSQVAEYIERIQLTGFDLDFPDINYSSASRAEALNWYESDYARLDLSIEYMNSWNPAWTSSVGHEPPKGMVYFPIIDTSNVTDMTGLFRTSSVRYIPYLDTSKVQNIVGLFRNNDQITKLPLLDFSNVTGNTTWAFNGCSELETVEGFVGLKVDLNLASCGKLTKQSVHNIVVHLGVPETTATLRVRYTNQYTNEDVALARSKNWSLVASL